MKGFTLVEILVAIAMMGILGTLGFINYRTFQSAQVLNSAVSEVQTILREAQSNATAGVKCQGSGGAIWVVTFEKKTTFNIECKIGISSALTQRSYSLPANIQVQSISSSSCDALYPFSVNFSPLYGVISFESSPSCVASQNSFVIRLTHTKTNESKNVSITKGGGTDVQN